MLLQKYTKNCSKGGNNGDFLTCTGLNNQQLLKHLPPSIATALGHLEQERNNLQSKKQVRYELEIEEDKDIYPDIESVNTHGLFATVILFNIKRKAFSNLTGSFPQKSR